MQAPAPDEFPCVFCHGCTALQILLLQQQLNIAQSDKSQYQQQLQQHSQQAQQQAVVARLLVTHRVLQRQQLQLQPPRPRS